MGQKLRAAKQELDRAKNAIDAIATASTLDEVDVAWKEVLGRLTRLWNKTEASLKGDPRFYNSPHVKTVKAATKGDPLIRYMMHARNADEHGVQDVTKRRGGAVQISAKNPDDTIFIPYVHIANGKVFVDAPGAKITFVPAEVTATAVTNRGQIYEVPTEHKGQPIGSATLITLARLGVDFYKDILDNLEKDGWDQ